MKIDAAVCNVNVIIYAQWGDEIYAVNAGTPHYLLLLLSYPFSFICCVTIHYH